MLTKTDIKAIGQLLKPLRKDINTLKTDVSSLKTDTSSLRQDVSTLKQDLSGVKQDISTLKIDLSNVREMVEFTKNAVANILDWTQDIHESIVQEKLPERVKKLEQFLKSS